MDQNVDPSGSNGKTEQESHIEKTDTHCSLQVHQSPSQLLVRRCESSTMDLEAKQLVAREEQRQPRSDSLGPMTSKCEVVAELGKAFSKMNTTLSSTWLGSSEELHTAAEPKIETPPGLDSKIGTTYRPRAKSIPTKQLTSKYEIIAEVAEGATNSLRHPKDHDEATFLPDSARSQPEIIPAGQPPPLTNNKRKVASKVCRAADVCPSTHIAESVLLFRGRGHSPPSPKSQESEPEAGKYDYKNRCVPKGKKQGVPRLGEGRRKGSFIKHVLVRPHNFRHSNASILQIPSETERTLTSVAFNRAFAHSPVRILQIVWSVLLYIGSLITYLLTSYTGSDASKTNRTFDDVYSAYNTELPWGMPLSVPSMVLTGTWLGCFCFYAISTIFRRNTKGHLLYLSPRYLDTDFFSTFTMSLIFGVIWSRAFVVKEVLWSLNLSFLWLICAITSLAIAVHGYHKKSTIFPHLNTEVEKCLFQCVALNGLAAYASRVNIIFVQNLAFVIKHQSAEPSNPLSSSIFFCVLIVETVVAGVVDFYLAECYMRYVFLHHVLFVMYALGLVTQLHSLDKPHNVTYVLAHVFLVATVPILAIKGTITLWRFHKGTHKRHHASRWCSRLHLGSKRVEDSGGRTKESSPSKRTPKRRGTM